MDYKEFVPTGKTLVTGVSTVGGVLLQQNGGVPVLTPLVKGLPVVGGFADLLIALGAFYVGHKVNSDWLSEVVEGGAIGYGLGAIATMAGL